MAKKVEKEAPVSFEEAIQKLELIVEELESGDVPLEKAIELFQEGMMMSQLCGQKLEQVERKIEALVEENGEFRKKPFTGITDDAGDTVG
ncbi:exodeoxyribonuclease VII small subunit [Paenibacillus terrigena]|uniref:exodeoxyribonuclease VII small subunit n=1 Tax=Paenibacillus terrigena TaxID=369333 RepID=UPI0028D538CB|nr:exodeoxyribonuclease VII small subunit [Paenibacillus terrigena]